jgi:hypothetical protein
MMLNLIIEIAMQKIIDIAPRPKIHTRQNLPQIKTPRVRTTSISEAIHVIASVIGHDCQKGMSIGK